MGLHRPCGLLKGTASLPEERGAWGVISIGWEPGTGHWGPGVGEKPEIKPVMGCILAFLKRAPVGVPCMAGRCCLHAPPSS